MLYLLVVVVSVFYLSFLKLKVKKLYILVYLIKYRFPEMMHIKIKKLTITEKCSHFFHSFEKLFLKPTNIKINFIVKKF